MDWAWRFVNEIDNSPHRFRRLASLRRLAGGRRTAAPRGTRPVHRALMMSQTPDYEARCRAIARLMRGPRHPEHLRRAEHPLALRTEVRERFNYSVFGAAFYTSAMLHLMRGGATQRCSGPAPRTAAATA